MSIWYKIKKQEDIELSEDGTTLDVCFKFDNYDNYYIEIPVKFIKNVLLDSPPQIETISGFSSVPDIYSCQLSGIGEWCHYCGVSEYCQRYNK